VLRCELAVFLCLENALLSVLPAVFVSNLEHPIGIVFEYTVVVQKKATYGHSAWKLVCVPSKFPEGFSVL
jgi:hypothetical protein